MRLSHDWRFFPLEDIGIFTQRTLFELGQTAVLAEKITLPLKPSDVYKNINVLNHFAYHKQQ